jgi:hypothetical protein
MLVDAHGRLANRSGDVRRSRQSCCGPSIKHERKRMSVNTKQTSKVVATLASHTLRV